ncbi:MAG: hypothetical protein M0R70_15970 [Nitrospirae bacterium]|nr:hypothetical protein [Nitrospirota bacterium]
MFFLCTAINGAQASGAHAPSKEVAGKETNITIKRILDDTRSFEGKDVTVQGINRGWTGKCASSTMLTRSDWILEDETGCIYVTGRMPTGSSPDKSQGERIVVQGKVIFGSTGKPIIKAEKLVPMQK